jgi:hypothetical protein
MMKKAITLADSELDGKIKGVLMESRPTDKLSDLAQFFGDYVTA